MSSWKLTLERDDADCPEVLAYKLDHKYTEANLKLDHLKGSDLLRAQSLKEVCDKNGLSVFLGLAERRVHGKCFEEDEDEDWRELYYQAVNGDAPKIHDIDPSDESFCLRTVAEPEGTPIIFNLDLDEDILVQSDTFEANPDGEDWSGPTGNEGVTATHIYRGTVGPTVQT